MKKEVVEEGLFLVHQLFSKQWCEQMISFAEEIGFEEATVRTSSGPKMLKHIRNNDRVDLHDEKISEELWAKVKSFLEPVDGQSPKGLDSHLRFYRYFPGQIFKRHKDGSVTSPEGFKSKLTYLIYLNENYAGGQTLFRQYQQSEGEREKILHEITPETGSALIFRHEKWHESLPINSGTKYILRTDIFFASDQCRHRM